MVGMTGRMAADERRDRGCGSVLPGVATSGYGEAFIARSA